MIIDLTKGNPIKQILIFCFPLLVGNLFQQFYNITDSIIVGKFIGIDAFAAVGSVGSFNFLVIGMALGLCAGLAIPVAQDFGAGDTASLKRSTAHAVYLALGITAFLTIVMAFATRSILKLLNTPDSIIDYSYTYISIIFRGMGATVLYNLLAALLRALGNSRTPLYFLMIASVFNIAMEYLLVGVLRLGIAGAAYANISAQLLSGILCLVYIIKKCPILLPEKDSLKFRWPVAKRLLSIGLPMGLQYSITAFGSIMLQSAVNSLGPTAIASISGAGRVQNIITAPMDSVGASMASYVGQNYGARRMDRVRKGIRQVTAIGLIYAVFGFLINLTFGTTIAQLFIDSGEVEVLANIKQFLTINGIAYPVLVIIFIYRNSLQGLGYSSAAMLGGLSEMFARSLVGFAFVGAYGVTAVCFANPLAWIAADFVLIPLYFYAKKQLKYMEIAPGEQDAAV